MKIPFTPIHIKPNYLVSMIRSNYGDSVPIWLNTNSIDNRFDGGITGFFRNITPICGPFFKEFGDVFHGKIRDCVIESTDIGSY